MSYLNMPYIPGMVDIHCWPSWLIKMRKAPSSLTKMVYTVEIRPNSYPSPDAEAQIQTQCQHWMACRVFFDSYVAYYPHAVHIAKYFVVSKLLMPPPSLSFLLVYYPPLGEKRNLVLEGIDDVADDGEDSEEHDHDNRYHVILMDHCGGSNGKGARRPWGGSRGRKFARKEQGLRMVQFCGVGESIQKVGSGLGYFVRKDVSYCMML